MYQLIFRYLLIKKSYIAIFFTDDVINASSRTPPSALPTTSDATITVDPTLPPTHGSPAHTSTTGPGIEEPF